jgi:hypothetical protein
MSHDVRPSWLTSPYARLVVAAAMLVFVSVNYSAELGILSVLIFLLVDWCFALLAKWKGDNRILFLGRMFAVVLPFVLPVLWIFASVLSNPSNCKSDEDCLDVKMYRAP